LGNQNELHINNVDWSKVDAIQSSYGGKIDNILNANIVNYVKQSPKLTYLCTNPSDIFTWCVVGNKFISTSNVKTIPQSIIDNQDITHYKFLRCNTSRKYQLEIFNFLPPHLEELEIYWNVYECLIDYFLLNGLNLPFGLKKFTLSFRTNYDVDEYLGIDNKTKDEVIELMYAKMKIPFGCELLINIQNE
jgi:hypothetical protein